MGLKGLSYECRQLTEMVGLPDIMANTVSRGEIKQAIARYSNQEMKAEIQSSIKVGARWSEDPMDNAYLKYMSHRNLCGLRGQKKGAGHVRMRGVGDLLETDECQN